MSKVPLEFELLVKDVTRHIYTREQQVHCTCTFCTYIDGQIGNKDNQHFIDNIKLRQETDIFPNGQTKKDNTF